MKTTVYVVYQVRPTHRALSDQLPLGRALAILRRLTARYPEDKFLVKAEEQMQ